MTIRDIARLAGVSPATVSKVINGKNDDVSQETRAKIQSVIEEHNYVPYKKVLDRANRDSNIIALIVNDASDIFGAELVRGVEDYCFAHDMCVVVCSNDDSIEKERKYVHLLRKQSIRGVISFLVADPEPGTGGIAALADEGIQSVMLDDYQETPNALKTTFNNRAGGHMATRHLMEAGHKRIGFITVAPKKPYQKERFAGYRDALEEGGLPYDESLVYRSDESSRRRLGHDGANYMISQQVSAILCCDDHVAAGVYSAMHENGLRIPEDISVMGFDDTYFSEILYPPLSSVRQSAYDIGRSSAELLYKKLSDQPMESESVQIQPTLVPRSSVQPPDAKFQQEKPVLAVVGEICAEIRLGGAGGGAVRQAQTMQTLPGGWAVETARAMLAKGCEVHLVGCIGNDPNGRLLFETLSQSGIRMDGVLFEQELPTGTAVVVAGTDGAEERTVFAGANSALDADRLQGLARVLEKAGCCLLDEKAPAGVARALADICGAQGIELKVGQA